MTDFQHRVNPEQLTKPGVAILGFTDHRVQAFDLPKDEFELWGLNELHKHHDWKLFDRWFEVHDRKEIDTDADHIKALQEMDIPIYMQRPWHDIPAAVGFPKQHLEEALDDKYFTSSIAWEIALAIAMGARKIHIYGVDMATDTEYGQQRPACEYWIGIAKGRGIEVYIPETSDLLKCIGQYGFGEEGSAFRKKLDERIAWLHRQDNEVLAAVRKLDAQYEEMRAKLDVQYTAQKEAMDAEYHAKHEKGIAARFQLVGSIVECEFWRRSWSMTAAQSTQFLPDRTQDPRTGITASVQQGDGLASPKDADVLGVSAARRIGPAKPTEVTA